MKNYIEIIYFVILKAFTFFYCRNLHGQNLGDTFDPSDLLYNGPINAFQSSLDGGTQIKHYNLP